MSFRIVLDGERVGINEIESHIASYDETQVEVSLSTSDHGNDPAVAAGWTTIILQIVGMSSIAFFTIPAVTKKIRDTCAEWKNIHRDLNAFLSWLTRRFALYSYSPEIVFLDALHHLESKPSVLELSLSQWSEFPSPRFPGNDNFDYTTRIYYQFVFENQDRGQVYILLYDSQRNLLSEGCLGMYLGQRNAFWCV